MILKIQDIDRVAYYEGFQIVVKFHEFDIHGEYRPSHTYSHMLFEDGKPGTTVFCVAEISILGGQGFTVEFNLHAWLMENGKTIDSFSPCSRVSA